MYKNEINELGFYQHKLLANFKYFICGTYRFDIYVSKINMAIPKMYTVCSLK